VTDFLAWADEIERMAADVRLTREYQAELNWYRTYTRFDIEQILATAEGRVGFHAGMLYARCQQECGTVVVTMGPNHKS
jgi:hypothetical protein